jgi:hypothetical protein
MIIIASHAKRMHKYMNTKYKLSNSNAYISLNKKNLERNRTPKYAQTNVKKYAQTHVKNKSL